MKVRILLEILQNVESDREIVADVVCNGKPTESCCVAGYLKEDSEHDFVLYVQPK